MLSYKKFLSAVVIALCMVFPLMSSAAPGIKTLSGTVTKLNGNVIWFTTGSAATYSAETSHAQLFRKNGAGMAFSEIAVGDKISLTGQVWSDNSINASFVRNLSLYPHTSTFSGKISGLNPSLSTFTFTTKDGEKTVRTDQYTTFKKNSSSATFNDLELGFSVSVKGVWERSNAVLVGKSVQANVRLISIDITGAVGMVSPDSITVIGENNVIYGVTVTNATLVDKKNKKITLPSFTPGDTVRVWGKHVSGQVKVSASKVKNMSLPR